MFTACPCLTHIWAVGPPIVGSGGAHDPYGPPKGPRLKSIARPSTAHGPPTQHRPWAVPRSNIASRIPYEILIINSFFLSPTLSLEVHRIARNFEARIFSGILTGSQWPIVERTAPHCCRGCFVDLRFNSSVDQCSMQKQGSIVRWICITYIHSPIPRSGLFSQVEP